MYSSTSRSSRPIPTGVSTSCKPPLFQVTAERDTHPDRQIHTAPTGKIRGRKKINFHKHYAYSILRNTSTACAHEGHFPQAGTATPLRFKGQHTRPSRGHSRNARRSGYFFYKILLTNTVGAVSII